MKKVGVLTDRPGAVREQEEMNFCVLFVFPLNFCDMSLRWGKKKKSVHAADLCDCDTRENRMAGISREDIKCLGFRIAPSLKSDQGCSGWGWQNGFQTSLHTYIDAYFHSRSCLSSVCTPESHLTVELSFMMFNYMRHTMCPANSVFPHRQLSHRERKLYTAYH